MENFLTQARRFVESAIHALLVARDMELYFSHLDRELCWLGVDEMQHGTDRASLESFIAQNIEEHPTPLSLSQIWYNSTLITEDLCCVMAMFRISDNALNVRYAVQMKTSWLVKRLKNGTLQIVHTHFSIPFTPEQVVHDTQLVAKTDDYLRLQKMLHEKTAEINKFYNILSGGVCKLAFDENFRVIYASEYLLHMFGLTETDIVAAENCTHNFIYEGDIPMIRATLKEGLAAGGPFSLQYRVWHKNGNLVWVKVRGMFSGEFMDDGSPIYYCIFTDVTELVRSYEQIAQERERYRIMNELTEGIAFEYDMKNDVMEFPNRFEQYFDFQPVVKDFKKHVARNLFDEHETYRKIRSLCRQIASGQMQVGEEMRLKTRGGSPLWFSISMATLRGKDGQSTRVIGKLVDIDKRKSAQIALEKKSQRDPMTDLYNKVSAEQIISEDLNNLTPGTMAALLIIDIDNFKLINDTKGHFFGDHVIQSIADTMRTLFRDTDLLCRFGGDEFVVFMRGIYMESLVVEKAALLAKAINSGCLAGKDTLPVTVSIGIAITDIRRPLTYQQLFKRADKALYAAKNHGKNRFEVYNSTLEAVKYASYATRLNISSDVLYAQAQSYQAVVDTALDILLQAKHPRNAINEILRFLGTTLKLSQSYTSAFAGDQIQVVVQWTVEGNELPDRIPLNCINHLKNFDGDGVLLSSDTSKLPSPAREICTNLGNGALLQCLIRKNDQIIGLAGFSNAEPNRIWTQNEIDMLKTVTKILTNSFVDLHQQTKILADSDILS